MTTQVRAVLAVFAALLCLATAAVPPVVDNRPVVGILTLPQYFVNNASLASYFPGSYVKWVESGGVRVVPITFTSSPAEISAVFATLDGVLFTGGGAWFEVHKHMNPDGTLTQYAAAGKQLFDLVVQANKQGRYVPLWATCLGFELMLFVAAGSNETVLYNDFNSMNLPLPLHLTEAAYTSRLFSGVDPAMMNTLTANASTFNDHRRGVNPYIFSSNPRLSSIFNVLSTNADRGGLPFVSTVEGKDLPLYGSQWHPEKPQFVWDANQQIPHDAAAVAANAYFAKFFGSEVRRNTERLPVATDQLIYNFKASFMPEQVPIFDQLYFFANTTISE